MNYDKLFILLNDTFGIDALESEMQEIVNEVLKMQSNEFNPGDLVDVKRAQDKEWLIGDQTEFVCFVSYKGMERYITYSGGYLSDWACCKKHL